LRLTHSKQHSLERGTAMQRMDQVQTNQSAQPDNQLQEEIRRRAFHIYQRRGMTDGLDLDDWLQAEAELREADHKWKAA